MWRALRRGDPRGLEELMSRYTSYVAAVAARVLPGRPPAGGGRTALRQPDPHPGSMGEKSPFRPWKEKIFVASGEILW